MRTNNKNKTSKNYIEFGPDEFLNLPNDLNMTGEEFDKFIADYLSGKIDINDFENMTKNKKEE